MTHRQSTDRQDAQFFLPDFSSLTALLVVVIIGELLAMILTLSPLRPDADRWQTLSLLSLFIQWLGLSSAALLSLLRRPLSRLHDTQAGLACYAILLLNTLLFTEIAYQAIVRYRLIEEAGGVDHLGFLLRTVAIGAIIHALALRYFYVAHKWRSQVRAEAQARLQALQARIRPHFLFNTMNTIASLIRDQPAQAEEAVEDLSDLMRMNLRDQGQFIPLAEELELCHRYLHIEKLRLGDRLQVEWTLAVEADALTVPPLLIQPLLENAIYHGIEPSARGGRLRVASALTKDGIEIRIENPLPVPETGGSPRSGNRMALDNIRQRLALAYGEQARLTVHNRDGLFQVIITLPAPP